MTSSTTTGSCSTRTTAAASYWVISTLTARYSARNSTDDRGRLLEELIEEHILVVLNMGAGTFVRSCGETSHLDIAMASANISRIANWTFLDDTLGSDHLPIVIPVNDPAVVEESSQPHWMYRKADWKGFKDDCKRQLTEDINTDDVTTSCNNVVGAILQAAEKNVPYLQAVQESNKKAGSILDRRVHSGRQRTKQGKEQDAVDT